MAAVIFVLAAVAVAGAVPLVAWDGRRREPRVDGASFSPPVLGADVQ